MSFIKKESFKPNLKGREGVCFLDIYSILPRSIKYIFKLKKKKVKTSQQTGAKSNSLVNKMKTGHGTKGCDVKSEPD